MDRYKKQMQGNVYVDVCFFVAKPGKVAAALEFAQAEFLGLSSLHTIGRPRYGLSVGTIVRGKLGDTLSENGYYKIIPLQANGKGRKKMNKR